MTEKTLPHDDPDFKGVPYIGCPVTIPSGSDCYPGTVIWVSEKTVEVKFKNESGHTVKRHMPTRIRVVGCAYKATKDNTYTEDQGWEYYEDTNPGPGREYSWRPKRNGYIAVGTSIASSAAQRIGLGFRRAYRDPCF